MYPTIGPSAYAFLVQPGCTSIVHNSNTLLYARACGGKESDKNKQTGKSPGICGYKRVVGPSSEVGLRELR